jgi:hypothetical protein
MIWTAEFFWKVFQATGAVWAYVVYRRLRRLRPHGTANWN